MKKIVGTKSGADLAAAALAAALLLVAAAAHVRALAPAPAAPAGLACAPAGCGAASAAGSACDGLARLVLGGRLDLNRAGATELDQVPGVGLATARRVVAARARAGRFASVEAAVVAADLRGASAAALWQWTEARP